LDEAVDPDDAAGGAVDAEAKKDKVSERERDDANGEDAAAAAEANDRRNSEIELFFDGETPEGANGAKPTGVKDVEVADEEREGEDGVSGNGGASVSYPAERIAAEENEEVERPDAQNAAQGKLG
jgi:hypothetical protein